MSVEWKLQFSSKVKDIISSLYLKAHIRLVKYGNFLAFYNVTSNCCTAVAREHALIIDLLDIAKKKTFIEGEI